MNMLAEQWPLDNINDFMSGKEWRWQQHLFDYKFSFRATKHHARFMQMKFTFNSKWSEAEQREKRKEKILFVVIAWEIFPFSIFSARFFVGVDTVSPTFVCVCFSVAFRFSLFALFCVRRQRANEHNVDNFILINNCTSLFDVISNLIFRAFFPLFRSSSQFVLFQKRRNCFIHVVFFLFLVNFFCESSRLLRNY